MRVYRNPSLVFLLAKAAATTLPQCCLTVEHSFSTGFFCSFEGQCGKPITAAQTRILDQPCAAQSGATCPSTATAWHSRRPSRSSNNPCRRTRADLLRSATLPWWSSTPAAALLTWHSPLALSTAALPDFKLIRYPPGLLIQFLGWNTLRIARFRDQPHLFRIFHEHKQWGRTIGVRNTGKLNELIYRGRLPEFIRMAEAFHEKIARLADQIAERRRTLKVILISDLPRRARPPSPSAWPSNCASTALPPPRISLDDYYVNDADNPRDAAGRPDYEHIDAIDVPLFNRHLLELIQGREIELPSF